MAGQVDRVGRGGSGISYGHHLWFLFISFLLCNSFSNDSFKIGGLEELSVWCHRLDLQFSVL
jgi:hypothetical protein